MSDDLSSAGRRRTAGLDADASSPASAPPGGGRRAIAVIAGGTFLVQAISVVTGIISARLLGVEGRGQIALIAAVSALLARLTMSGSLPVTISQLLARERLNARDGLRPFLRSWSLLALVPSGAAFGCLALLLRDESAVVQYGLAAAAAAMTYQTIATGIVAACIRGELASPTTVVVGALLLQAPLLVVLTAAAALGLIDNAVTVAAIIVCAGFAGWLLNLRLLKSAEGKPSTLQRAEIRRMTAANFISAVGSINGLGIDRNLVGVLLGTVQLGLYAVAFAFANVGTIIGTALGSLLLPRLAANPDDREVQRSLVRSWLGPSAILLACIVAVLQLILEPALRIAFGEPFLPALETARWLVLADGLLGFRKLQVAVLQARGRGGIASLIELVATGVVIGGVITAAALGSLVGVGITMALAGATATTAFGVAMWATRPH